MPDERYIIEHDTRGTVMDQEYDDLGPKSLNLYLGWRTRFSWSGSRTEAEIYFSLERVKLVLSRIDPKLRRACKVRRYGTWSVVPWTSS